MSEAKVQAEWPFPSASAYTIRLPGEEGSHLTVAGNPAMIESYLERFGCVPVFDGNPRRRQIARLSESGEWTLSELDGTTELETPAEQVDDQAEQLRILCTHNWYHVGFTANPQLTEFNFNPSGEGFSRYSSWGYNTKVPTIEDYYWRFSLAHGVLSIEWEDHTVSPISIILSKKLRAASSLKNGRLTFYEMTLKVSSPLFPESSSFAQHLLDEYWGKQKKDD